MIAEDRAQARADQRAAARARLRTRLTYAIGPTLVLAMGATVMASAQSSSPFANKKTVQAWEVPQEGAPGATASGAAGASAPSLQLRTRALDAETAGAPPPLAGAAMPAPAPAVPAPAPLDGAVPSPAYTYSAPDRGARQAEVQDDTDWTIHELPRRAPLHAGPGAPAPGPYGSRSGPTPLPGQWVAQPQASAGPYGNPHSPAQAGPYGQPVPNGPGPAGPYDASPWPPDPSAKPGFFGRIKTLLRGAVRGGVAARETDGWEEAFIGDADVEAELSTVTRNGIEWGVHGQVRAQYDEGRKGFTRRLPDCPPTTPGCPGLTVAGLPGRVAVRGHTSQFYTAGPDVAKDAQVALESAHLFVRSAYGDVTLGRDDGSAFLFSLGAPTLMTVGASNSPVDYTGLDAVKTVNDASGFAEKVTYTSPRLLGDQVGLGVQLGVSYAPDASACGVDYCVDLNDIENVVAPDIQDVMEAGIALDRTFAPGVSAELTGTFARGSETSGLAGLDDLQAFGAGLELKMRDWTLGGSYLDSNQGLENGDYRAYDVGLTWKPSMLGFTVGYGHATDDLVRLKSDQFVGGVSYDVNERIRVGAGVQYTDRESVRDVAGTAQIGEEKATALFIEGGITF